MAEIKQIRLSGVTYDIVDDSAIHSLDGYWNSGQTESAITAATAALAETIAEQGYQTSGDVQNAIAQSISGKVDTSTFETYSGNVETALASKFAGAEWSSNDKKIYFYDNPSNSGTALAYIDGTDFVKDGFLSSVTIDNRTISGESVPCLVFIWNTDSGIQETDIPLSGIFDPSNYYTSAETDDQIEAATSGKVDTLVYTAYTASTNARLAEDEEVTAAGMNALNDALDGKQATLVSGTNIKTINSQSLLGAGDITIQSGNQVEVSGTTLVFL